MSDLNRVMLIGRLGADPELRYTPAGKPVASLRIATSEKWKDRDTQDPREKTEWHSIVAWDGLATILSEYTRKGSQIFVEGKLQTRKWQDKEGKDRYTTEIIAQSVQLLARAPEQSGQTSQQRTSSQRPPQQQSKPTQRQPEPSADFDDDIPF